MSTKQEELIKNVKESNESGVQKNANNRVLALDVLKGIAIILVVLSHIAYFVMRLEDYWMYWTLYILLDVFGPSMFVFLSAQSVVFSQTKKKTSYFDPVGARKTTFRRAYAIIIIGWIYNLGFNLVSISKNYGPVSFWYWHILQFIGFSQIFTYFALKLRPRTRIIITIVIFAITYPLFNFITRQMAGAGINYKNFGFDELSNGYALFYFIVFEPFWLSPLLPWFAYPFISSIVGQWMVQAIEKGNRSALILFVKKLIAIGAFLVLTGILTGLSIVQEDYHSDLWLSFIEPYSPDWIFPNGIPIFLIHGSLQFMLYNLGMAILLVAITFYLIDIRKKKGKIVKILSFYGMVSLSVYIYHQLFALIFPWKVGPVVMFVVFFVVTAITGYILWILVSKFKGVGTLESIIVAAGGIKRVKAKYEAKIAKTRDSESEVKKLKK